MGYFASPPTREVVAARPQSALVAAPIAPLPHLAHPNGTSGTNPLLGLEPTALAQTPCRMVAAISTTEGERKKDPVSVVYPQKLVAKCTVHTWSTKRISSSAGKARCSAVGAAISRKQLVWRNRARVDMNVSRCRPGMYIVSADPPMKRLRSPVSAARRSRCGSGTLLYACMQTGNPT
jgi:hypothetical protein